MSRFLISFILLFISSVSCFSQSVRVICYGDGKTKTEATKCALNEAISKAYGSFVSSRATVDNNNLTDDHISMISQGSVKSYKEISYTRSSFNDYTVVIEAEVTLNKHNIEYADNRGDVTYINGAALSANITQEEFNRKNTIDVLKHMLEKLYVVGSSMYSYKIKTQEPIIKNKYAIINVEITCLPNKQVKTYTYSFIDFMREIKPYVDETDRYTLYVMDSYRQFVYNLYRVSCYNWEINDNMGNKVFCAISNVPQISGPHTLMCANINRSCKAYIMSHGVEISQDIRVPFLKYNDDTNIGKINLQLRYKLSNVGRLKQLTIKNN